MGMRSFMQRQLARIPLGRKYCCICNSSFASFIPYQGWKNAPALMFALDVVGSDAKQFTCPKCYAHDRERHLFLYFKKLGLVNRFHGAHVLHFAPEPKLGKIIEAQQPGRYVKCDLYPNEPDVVRVDITNISFESGSFDFVLANHVLEHVDDDIKALSEIFRILKKGGFAILQTPYSRMLLSTWSDPGISSDEARLQAYGQEDHVRLYGSDIFNRFQSVGFVAHISFHNDVLSEIDPARYGVNVKEPFFLLEKTS